MCVRCFVSARFNPHVTGANVACLAHQLKWADPFLSALEEIVDRAIAYTDRILATAPNYRGAAIAGLRKLRDNLARTAPDDAAIRKLEVYLDGLARHAAP
jgi:hypothetical protein